MCGQSRSGSDKGSICITSRCLQALQGDITCVVPSVAVDVLSCDTTWLLRFVVETPSSEAALAGLHRSWARTAKMDLLFSYEDGEATPMGSVILCE